MRAPTLMDIILFGAIQLELVWIRELGGVVAGCEEIEEDHIAGVGGDGLVAVGDGGGWGGTDAEDAVGWGAAYAQGFEDVFAEFGEGCWGVVLG